MCARRVSSSPLWVPVGSYSVKVITGTSSMPRGLMTGWEAPRFCGNQSWFEYTWLYNRTRASWRAMPTSNCTVITAWPWRDTEYTCSTPLISLITCSAGVAIALSTSRVLAPGIATMMSAMVTSIWGSSSFGVTTTDRIPRIIARIASMGVRWLFWKARAMAPDGPIGGRLSLTAITPLYPGAFRQAQAFTAYQAIRVGHYPFAFRKPGQNFQPAVVADTHADLAQPGLTLAVQHEHGPQFAALNQGAGRHPQGLPAGYRYADFHQHAGEQAAVGLVQAQPQAEGVGVRIGVGIERQLPGFQDPAISQGNGSLAFAAGQVCVLLGQVNHHPKLLQRQAAEQRLARTHRLPQFHMALGQDSAIGGNNAGVVQLFLRFCHRGFRPLHPGPGRTEVVPGLVKLLPRHQAPLMDGFDTGVLLPGILQTGAGFFKAGFRLPQA